MVEFDDASAVLPPPREVRHGPSELDGSSVPLWHTASFAAVARTPPPRSKVAMATAALLAALVIVGGYVGFQAASVGGLLPPAPPRHVVADDKWMKKILMPDQLVRAERPRSASPTVRPRGDKRPGRGGDAVYPLRSH